VRETRLVVGTLDSFGISAVAGKVVRWKSFQRELLPLLPDPQ